jgi:hypothetical protein
VHKCILSANIGYFKNGVPPWVRGDAAHEEDFSLNHPKLIGAMLNFLYTGVILNDEQSVALGMGDYSERKRAFACEGRHEEMNLSLYARMFHLGCRFDIPLLRKKSISWFKDNVARGTFYLHDLVRATHIAFHTGSDTECQMRDRTFEALLKDIRSVASHDWIAQEIAKIPGLGMRLLVALAKTM